MFSLSFQSAIASLGHLPAKILLPAIALMPALTLVLAGQPARAEIITKTVPYEVDGQSFTGFLAYNSDIKGKRPGVLVVHEWWGLNDYARKRARMLAELGYTAFALDMYGTGKVTDHPKEAKAFSQEAIANLPQAEKRFRAALDILKAQPSVNPDKIAAIGYCFGGGVVLHMARVGTDLAGVASFHGSLAARAQAKPGAVKAQVLVMTGEADKFITPTVVDAFKKEMDAAGADYEVVVYPGATHSFTNPEATEIGKKYDLPIAYDANADKKSWEKMQAFFNDLFNPE